MVVIGYYLMFILILFGFVLVPMRVDPNHKLTLCYEFFISFGRQLIHRTNQLLFIQFSQLTKYTNLSMKSAIL